MDANRHFQARWASQFIGCLFWSITGYLRWLFCVYTETFHTDFRPSASDQQSSAVQSDNNRPPQYLHPTTDGHPHQPSGNYHVGATRGQRRNKQGIQCEWKRPFYPSRLFAICVPSFQFDKKITMLTFMEVQFYTFISCIPHKLVTGGS